MDVSALLHFGMNAEAYKQKTSCYYNVGGIHKVMRQIALAFAENDSVVLVFDSKTNFRKALMPEYKAGRVTNKSVISQAELLFEKLPQIGFTCYKIDGYEGDDIINWCCQEAEQTYQKIFIHGNDQDLIHNVHGGVIFHSISENVPSVTESNFPYAIDKGSFVPFNFISVKKVLTGCKSDKIPAFIMENGTKGSEVFEWYLKALALKNIPGVYEYTTNRDIFLKFMQYLPGVTDKDLRELERRVKLIFPAPKPDDFIFSCTARRQIDEPQLSGFLSLVNDFKTIRSLKLYKRDLTEEEKAFLRERQRQLETGEFAVDKNIPVHEQYDDSLLCLKEF